MQTVPFFEPPYQKCRRIKWSLAFVSGFLHQIPISMAQFSIARHLHDFGTLKTPLHSKIHVIHENMNQISYHWDHICFDHHIDGQEATPSLHFHCKCTASFCKVFPSDCSLIACKLHKSFSHMRKRRKVHFWAGSWAERKQQEQRRIRHIRIRLV
jgi:hypothetical protein